MLAPLLLLAAAAHSQTAWTTSWDEALAKAKASGKPVLADFQAPWCYSCYYMEQRVLSKAGFAKAAEGLVPLKLDVDTAEGAALKASRSVTFLPTYLVLDGSGKERGRIVGEQTEPDFLSKLAALAGGKAPAQDKALAKLREKARRGDVPSLEKLLERPADCETPYDVEFAEKGVDSLYPEHRKAALARERLRLQELAEARLFGPPEARCADFRSGVEALASVHEKLGDAAARAALLDRALAQLEREGGAAGEDRNRDDNERFFLELKGDEPRLAAWYEKLLAAYPSDYVYPYRLAKHLHEKGRDAEALPQIEKADKLAYGANRLAVTGARAKILAALGRKDEARAIVERDLKAAPRALKKERDELEAVRKNLPR